MKKLLLFSLIGLLALGSLQAQEKDQEPEGYKFTIDKQLDATSVKNQYRSGTCWSFSALSFIESEMIRQGKEHVDLSEMWVVRHSYSDKAEQYVRWHGNLNFAGGGAFHDATNCILKYGMVPEEAYQGLNYGTDKHVHGEIDAVLKGYVDQVLENKNRELTPTWHKGFNGILDAYLGEIPETFTYKGTEYTPKSFVTEVMGIDANDYVALTSYTHHPFYEPFIIEVPDNWAMEEAYNLPIDDLMQVMDNAIDEGFTIAWASDVSEKGFSWTNGVAVVPETNFENLNDTEQSKWSKLTDRERRQMLYSFDGPRPEKKITQEDRQVAFDNWTTTDDHGMHMTGIAHDQNGTKYYLIKNSWSDQNHVYDGYFYASETFVRYKTMDILVHKDALPKNIAKKLGIK